MQNDLKLRRFSGFESYFDCQFLPHHNLQPPFNSFSYISNSGDLKRLKIKELKELLRSRGLPVSGIKEALVKILIAAQSPGDNEVKQEEQE